MRSPELFSISGVPKPATRVTPLVVALLVVSTLPEESEEAPVTALAPLEAKALTLPLSVCKSGDCTYLRTPDVVLPESKVQDTTVPKAVPPVTVCEITSSD